ncbi:MAG: hypothetical protein WC812_02080 [Candidatus Pacearchaeota archaeon]|jgi:hypothetical protein
MVKLLQLVQDESLKPKYILTNNFFCEGDLSEFTQKQENPNLEFYGYNNLEPSEIKKIALGLLKNLSYDDVTKQITEAEQKLDDLKFWNYHKFWKKNYWTNFNGVLMDGLSLALGGAFIYARSTGWGLAAFGVCQAVGEAHRRQEKNYAKDNLKAYKKLQQDYENIVENIEITEKSQIKIHISQEAKKAIKQVRGIQSFMHSNRFSLNLNSLNQEITTMYFAFD